MLLGGSKKKSLSQMMKQQQLQGKKDDKKTKSAGEEKKLGKVNLPNLESKEFVNELAKMRAITPYMLASRYNVKVSVAKDILEQLRAKGLIQMVSGSNRVRVFQIAAA